MTSADIARIIDHTLLRPEATEQQVVHLCDEAVTHGFGAVCVAASRVAAAARRLAGAPVKVAAVIGFPHGNTLTAAKAAEARATVDAGADELDMVINVGMLKDGDDAAVEADVAAVVRAGPGLVKVIIETSLLSNAEKRRACRLAVNAGAHFVKTSTGFNGGGATADDIRLMREAVGPTVGVKASGGIRTYADAVAMIAAGATRLGCSASVAVVTLAAREGTPHGY